MASLSNMFHRSLQSHFIFPIFLIITLLLANVSSSPTSKKQLFQPNCGGSVTLQKGHVQELKSPNYPFSYPNGVKCLWIAYSPPGTTIRMKCDKFNVAPSLNCNLDVFYFSPSGDISLQQAQYYCGRGQLDVTTKGNRFAAGFFTHTLYQNFYPGFACLLTVVEDSSTTKGNVPNPDTTEAPKPVTKPPVTDDCPCGIKGGSRIVGGKETGINEWPWQAGIRFFSNGEIFCGATLISDRWLVTAAHCVEFFRKEDIYVSLGDHDKTDNSETGNIEQHITVDTIIMHEDYDSNTVDNDIALLRLSGPITINEGIRPICLPFEYAQNNFSGTKGTVTGWGQLVFNGQVSNVLQEVELPILTTDECRNFEVVAKSLTQNMICTYKPGFDACKGDSGGPLQWEKDGRHYLVGIVSFGKGCADEGSPGVYTKLTNYLEWIEQNTSADLCSPA